MKKQHILAINTVIKTSFFACLLLFSISAFTQTSCKPDNYIPDSFFTPKYIPQGFNIQIVGNGNIQKTFESGEDIPASTGIGVVISKFFLNRENKTFMGMYKIDVQGTINIASTVDTLAAEGLTTVNNQQRVTNTRSFGTSVLTPLSQGQAMNLEIIGYNRCTYGGIISGFSFKYTGSNRIWKLNADTSVQTTSNLLRLGIFHDIVPYESRTDYSVTIGVSGALNGIGGDIGQKVNENLRQTFLQTTKRTFWGFDVNVGIRLKNIKAEFNYIVFPSSTSVPGLTGGRLITTIGFVGGFPIKVN